MHVKPWKQDPKAKAGKGWFIATVAFNLLPILCVVEFGLDECSSGGLGFVPVFAVVLLSLPSIVLLGAIFSGMAAFLSPKGPRRWISYGLLAFDTVAFLTFVVWWSRDLWK